jgi:hypothetical protein
VGPARTDRAGTLGLALNRPSKGVASRPCAVMRS